MFLCVFIHVKTIQWISKKIRGAQLRHFPGQLSTNEVSMSKGLCPKTFSVKKWHFVSIFFGFTVHLTAACITSYMLSTPSLGCQLRIFWEIVSFSLISVKCLKNHLISAILFVFGWIWPYYVAFWWKFRGGNCFQEIIRTI